MAYLIRKECIGNETNNYNLILGEEIIPPRERTMELSYKSLDIAHARCRFDTTLIA